MQLVRSAIMSHAVNSREHGSRAAAAAAAAAGPSIAGLISDAMPPSRAGSMIDNML